LIDQEEATHFRDATIINRPVTEVWAFLQQPNSEAAWHPGVIEEKITSPGGLGVGATGLWRLLLLGAPIVMRKQAKSDLANLKRVVEARQLHL
jgi:ligand-binding SRPBCC domain-containing protein